MPQINKLRVVNFSYNNGRRLIPDAVFPFSHSEGQPTDTFISLSNGGGKSVLTQLMLQPILPRQRLAKRRIEDFFERSGDHCFVLLEWRLDGTDRRLMTGIAIAASEPQSTDKEDALRGRAVKYYTFALDYGPLGDEYDLTRLALSQTESHRFTPKPFGYVRELAAKKNTRLQVYSAERQAAYQELLQSYGISPAEWKNVVWRVNETEGGMIKYFESFATSNQLVDRLLIPSIESGLTTPREEQEDDRLSDILLNYTREYQRKEQEAATQQQATALRDALAALDQPMESLHSLESDTRRSAAELHGFNAALTVRTRALAQEQVAAKAEKEACAHARQRLLLEKASNAYYKAQDTYAAAQAALQEVKEQNDALDHTVQTLTHRKQCWECAEQAGRIARDQDKLHTLETRIRALQEPDDTQRQIDELRSCVAAKAIAEQEKLRGEQEALSRRQTETTAALDACQRACRELDKEQQSLRGTCSKTDGILDQLRRQIDKDGDVLNVQVVWRLDGEADVSAVTLQQQRMQDELAASSQQLQDLSARMTDRKHQLQELRSQEDALKDQQREKQARKAEKDKQLRRYEEEEAALHALFDRQGLRFEERFTPAPLQAMQGRITRLQEKRLAAQQREAALTEQQNAIRQGSLHVPTPVIDYLKRRRFTYQTCEHYLMSGSLTPQQIGSLLKAYPVCAYGVLMEEADIRRLLRDAERSPEDVAQLFAAIVPLFTYAQMEEMLAGRYSGEGQAIAFYAKGYFEQRDRYAENLSHQLEDIRHDIQLLREQEAQLAREADQVKAFPYTEGYQQEQLDALQALSDKLAQLHADLAEIKRQQQACDSSIDDMLASRQTMQTAITRLEHWLQDCQKLQEQEAEYRRQRGTLEQLQQQLQACSARRDKTEAERRELQNQQEYAQQRLNELHQRIDRLTNYLTDVDCAASSDTLPQESVDALFDRFQALTRQRHDAAALLMEQQEQLRGTLREHQEQLRRIGLPPEDYEALTFSQAELTHVTQQLTDHQAQQAALNTELLQANTRAARADMLRQQQLDAVHALAVEPLPKEQLRLDFAAREQQLQERSAAADQALEAIRQEQQTIETLLPLCTQTVADIPCEAPQPVQLQSDCRRQYQQLTDRYKQQTQAFQAAQTAFLRQLRALQSQYKDKAPFNSIVDNAVAMAESPERSGDRYFTLHEQLQHASDGLDKLIAQIAVTLADLDARREEVISQCVRQGEIIYSQLKLLMESSMVQFKGRSTPVPMLKLDLPQTVDKEVARAQVAQELQQGVNDLLKLMQTDAPEADQQACAARLVSSRHLLNQYIGRDSLTVQVYKIDLSQSNSRHRSWEDTLVKNSGGERFVIYFALLVTLMNYARSAGMTITDKKSGSVLVLDNPFGPITSAHLLGPMFDIARAFRVQLICFSDISKTDVVQCFSCVLKILIRSVPLSHLQTLSVQSDESIEYGMFQQEQLSLL